MRAGHIAAIFALTTSLANTGRAGTPIGAPIPQLLQNVDVIEHLGEAVPPDLSFVDNNGKPVKLGDYFNHGRPVLLTLVYYRCPMLCSLVMNGALKALGQTGWKLGKDYDAVTVSFDPAETPQMAAEQRRGYLQSLFGSGDSGKEWPFLTGRVDMIRSLTDAVGFKYNYDAANKQFAHTAAIYVLTPKGNVAHYLYGVSFESKELRLALADAGEGRVGPTLDRVLLSCYRYNPASRKYELFVARFLQTGGLLVLLAVGLLVGRYWRKEVAENRITGAPRKLPLPIPPPRAKGARS